MNYSDKLIQTYHGCRDGWKTVTSRPASDADRFIKVLSLVRPHFIHRAI